MSSPRFSGKQIVALVAIVAGALVLAPVAVGAATGSFVNITDPVTSSHKARVGAAGGLWSTLIDPTTKSAAKVTSGKLQVGDGSGALTVDGTVRAGDGSGPLTVDGTVDTAPGKPRQPYVMTLASGEETGSLSMNLFGTVPAGKTFVIETVSTEISVPKTQQPGKVLLYCETNGTAASHYQQFLYQQTDSSGSYDEFMSTHDVHIYCDAGNSMQGVAIRNATTGYWHLYMTLSGYLV
jgi:hypothetical protein